MERSPGARDAANMGTGTPTPDPPRRPGASGGEGPASPAPVPPGTLRAHHHLPGDLPPAPARVVREVHLVLANDLVGPRPGRVAPRPLGHDDRLGRGPRRHHAPTHRTAIHEREPTLGVSRGAHLPEGKDAPPRAGGTATQTRPDHTGPGWPRLGITQVRGTENSRHEAPAPATADAASRGVKGETVKGINGSRRGSSRLARVRKAWMPREGQTLQVR